MFASVILDSAIDTPFDYRIPDALLPLAAPGMRVLVPLRKGQVKGTIIALKERPDVQKIQEIIEFIGERPHLPEDLLQLGYWMAEYYVCPLRKVLKAMLPPSVRQEISPKKQLFIKSLLSRPELGAVCEKLRGSKQAEILDVMLAHPQGILLTELLEKSKTSRSPLDTLIKKEVLIALDLSGETLEHDYFATKAKLLNQEQQEALEKISETLQKERFAVHLLYGVTGSGKTEVYLQAIDKTLAMGKGALMLVPEIALTSQTMERLKSRFQDKVAILHHRLSDGERALAWKKIRDGSIRLVIGARSAIFCPCPNLGVIIIDEEHESSYKQQDEAPCFHARDVAVMRGKFSNATVILGTATPSFESFSNAVKGKYILSKLTARPGQANLAKVRLIDMRKEYEKTKGFTLFSEPLLEAIKKRAEIGEQSLIFLNRRGYNLSAACQLCSHTLKCPHCDISLTFHRGTNLLACHLCNMTVSPPPRLCPHCKRSEGLKYKGSGTEQVERTLHALFPTIRTLRVDADTTRHKGSHEQIFKQFRSGKADVLIGTQMIAKGLHFPSVTLVGVLNADHSLQIPDFRASENVFQLITQVAGRSGRGALPGEVIIQTSLPEHPTILHACEQNFEAFFSEEIESRKLFSFPPYTHLVKLTFAGPSQLETENCAKSIRQQMIALVPPTTQLLPVNPCGHAKIKDNFRFQFLIKEDKIKSILNALSSAKESLAKQKEVKLVIDIDPLSTYF